MIIQDLFGSKVPGRQPVEETHEHGEYDIAALQKHFGPTVAFDAASHGPAMMQRKDTAGKTHQLVRQPSGNYQSQHADNVEEGAVTDALVGGTLGALAAGAPGAYMGAGIGMAAGGAWRALKKKQKAAADTYTDNVLDSKLKQQAWKDYVDDWKDYIKDMRRETFSSLGGFSDDYRPGYSLINDDDPESRYIDKKLWNRLYTIQTHFLDSIEEIARSKKTEAQKTKDFEHIGQRAAAEFQKHRKVGESVEQGVTEESNVTEAQSALARIRDNVSADSIGRDREGNLVFRKGYFYKSGGDADQFARAIARQLTALGINHQVIDDGEVWRPFRGGAKLRDQSHWWVKVRLMDGPSDQDPASREITEASTGQDTVTVTPVGDGFRVGTTATAGPILVAIYYVFKDFVNKKGAAVFTKSGRRLTNSTADVSKVLDNRPNGLVFKFDDPVAGQQALTASVEKAMAKVRRGVDQAAKHKASAPARRAAASQRAAQDRRGAAADYAAKYGAGTWNRVTYKQEDGDDGYSYVLRVDGRPKWNGLTQREAQAYKEQEVDAIAQREKLGKYAAVSETSDYARRRRREEDIISGQAQPRKRAPAQTSDYARRRAQEKKQGVEEGGPFSYGYKKPRRGTVAHTAELKRKEHEKKTPPIEPRDQRVGVAKVTKDVAEETQRLDPKCWTGYKKQGTKMKGGVRVNNCVPRDSVKESLSWSQLDPGLSVADKMTIFEDFHTNGNLTESTEQDNKDYFVNLAKLADSPAKNQKYIVIPLALIHNQIMPLDRPQLLMFVGENTNGMEFESDAGSVTYPSNTIREMAVYNTFTFGTAGAYDKFRTALALKFDTELPAAPSTGQVKETAGTDPKKDPYNRGYFDALSLTKRSQSPYPPGSAEDREYHAGFESGYADRRDHYS